MNDKQKIVMKSKYKDNCWVLVSGTDKRDGARDYLGNIDYTVSFLYDAGDIATEWEPKYGPIQIWDRCEKDSEDAKEHYYFDYHNTAPASWSQLAVDENNLHFHFIAGDFDYIFNVLKDWSNR